MNDHDQQTTTERLLEELRQELDALHASDDARAAAAAAETARADKAEQSTRDLLRENALLTNRIRDRAVIEQAKGVLVERFHLLRPAMVDGRLLEPMDLAGEAIRRKARRTNQTMDDVAADIVAHLTPELRPSQPGHPAHQDCAVCAGQAMDSDPVNKWRVWGAACLNYHLSVELWETMTLAGAIYE